MYKITPVYFIRRSKTMRTLRKLLSLFLVLCLTLGMGTLAMAAATEEELQDPYVYCFAPSQDRIPSYYAF